MQTKRNETKNMPSYKWQRCCRPYQFKQLHLLSILGQWVYHMT